MNRQQKRSLEKDLKKKDPIYHEDQHFYLNLQKEVHIMQLTREKHKLSRKLVPRQALQESFATNIVAATIRALENEGLKVGAATVEKVVPMVVMKHVRRLSLLTKLKILFVR